jgi:hypothetical protein
LCSSFVLRLAPIDEEGTVNGFVIALGYPIDEAFALPAIFSGTLKDLFRKRPVPFVTTISSVQEMIL